MEVKNRFDTKTIGEFDISPEANLSEANLSEANLRGANLRGANLRGANLSGADLSGVTGLLNCSEWLLNNFERDDLGIIVYKASGHTFYSAPKHWAFKPGEFLEEVVNPLPTITCGCGVNFATRDWIDKKLNSDVTVWKCRIHWIDLSTVVVPYNTDGKARCGKLELLEKV